MNPSSTPSDEQASELRSKLDDFRLGDGSYLNPDEKQQLQALIAHHTKEAERRAEFQAILNMGARLRDEFLRRDLTTDNLPKGYRKMSNSELVAKVVNEMLPAELSAPQQSKETIDE